MHPSIDPLNMTGHPEEKPCPYLRHSLCDCVEKWQSEWVAGWEDGVYLLEVGTMVGSLHPSCFVPMAVLPRENCFLCFARELRLRDIC